jgi:AcrR family transcriptional regulator
MKSDEHPATEESDVLLRMRDTAARLIARSGIAGFKIREVADELGIAPTLPLYYFGTAAGLFGAVAEYGFTQLAEQLREARRSSAPSVTRLERMASSHGRYGLEVPLLYQAMHSPGLWGHSARSSSASSAAGKADRLIERAKVARDRAFDEYVKAVTETQKIGAMRKEPSGRRFAHLLSALVDGFLFHVREEQVLPEASTEERLRYLNSLIRLATEGMA